MQSTYEDRGGVTILEYRQLATRNLLGFNVDLCVWESRPFVLISAREWTGYQQPRFALVHSDSDFLPTLRDLARLGVKKEVVRVIELHDPIHIRSGLPALEPQHVETVTLWDELTN